MPIKKASELILAQIRSLSVLWFQLVVTDELAPREEEEEEETREALCRWHETMGGAKGGKYWAREEETENCEPRSQELRGAAEDLFIFIFFKGTK